jgi:hypothetical protein
VKTGTVSDASHCRLLFFQLHRLPCTSRINGEIQVSSLGTDIVQFLLEFITNLLRPKWDNRVIESSHPDVLEHITGFLTLKIKHSQNITSMDTISWDFDNETCVCACVASCLRPDAQVQSKNSWVVTFSEDPEIAIVFHFPNSIIVSHADGVYNFLGSPSFFLLHLDTEELWIFDVLGSSAFSPSWVE